MNSLFTFPVSMNPSIELTCKRFTPYSKTETAKTHKKFGGNTCNDSGACKQKDCAPSTELGLLFLVILFFRVLAAMSHPGHFVGFDITRSRTTWSPVEDIIHMEDRLSRWRQNTLLVYTVLSTELLRGLVCKHVCVSPKLEEHYSEPSAMYRPSWESAHDRRHRQRGEQWKSPGR